MSQSGSYYLATRPTGLTLKSNVMQNFLLVFAILLIAACGSPKSGLTKAERAAKVKDPNEQVVRSAETSLDLTAYLRRIPGVQITGSGERAEVRIRGNASINGEYRPLLVVNGTPLGTNYSSLYTMIDTNEIDRVRVLKSASETSVYGVQGANGVIEITLR